MANTRNEEFTRESINLFNSTINMYLVEQQEDNKKNKYALALDGKIYVLTKEAIDKAIAAEKGIVFSKQTAHYFLSRYNLNQPGLISEELKKQMLNESSQHASNLVAFKLATMLYLLDATTLPSLIPVLANAYVNYGDEKSKQCLSLNSTYQPIPETAEIDGDAHNNIIIPKENFSKPPVKPTICGIMFFDRSAELAKQSGEVDFLVAPVRNHKH